MNDKKKEIDVKRAHIYYNKNKQAINHENLDKHRCKVIKIKKTIQHKWKNNKIK